MISKEYIIILSALFFVWSLEGQSYEAGVHYFDDNSYVEYLHGNIPLIISVPHGGEKKPSEIPDRECNGCMYVNDTNTQQLARELVENYFIETGCFPFVIFNRLHRSKLDANRAIIEAADGNAIGERAWQQYTDFINIASDSVVANFGKGLFIDLHGHAHDIQRLELGYLLSKSELQLDDEGLSETELVNKSSIRNLANENRASSFAALIRGEFSLGSLISERRVEVVPSPDDLYPEDSEAYFSGGYNTSTYGSRDGGMIDAIQIECNQDVRFLEAARKTFARELFYALREFLIRYYTPENPDATCFTIATKETDKEVNILYPNPATNKFYIKGNELYELKIYDFLGQLVLRREGNYTMQSEQDVSSLNEGYYLVHIKFRSSESYRKLLISR